MTKHEDGRHQDDQDPTITAATNTVLEKQVTSQSHASTTQNDAKSRSLWRRVYDVVSYTPPSCRYDPNKPPSFSMGMNVLFAFAACFTVANL